MTETKEKRSIASTAWRLCPVRNSLIIAGSVVIALYFTLRRHLPLMKLVSEYLVKPYHRMMGLASSVFPFSVAELVYVIIGIFALWYIIHFARKIKTGEDIPGAIYKLTATVLAIALCIYGGFCMLWGVYYHSFDFFASSGMEDRPISSQELRAVTEYFARLCNEYSLQVPRMDKLYTAEPHDILRRAETLYIPVEQKYTFLSGHELKPKAMVFSELMSHINFTGFFFPFTGEANLNINEPVCLLPSTCAHEIAHQRGVAAENEANFTAVLACMSSDDMEFKYSGALLAYINLGNALYSIDPDTYYSIAMGLNEFVRADLAANSAYWDRYETKAAEVSEAVYSGFLQSHGQTLGMKSYGACVDLLVVHYLEEAS